MPETAPSFPSPEEIFNAARNESSERQVSGRETSETLMMRAREGGTTDVAASIARMNDGERKRVAGALVGRLSQRPTSWSQFLDWQSRAAVLHAASPQEYQRLEPDILRNLRDAFRVLDQEWPDVSRFETFDRKGRCVFQLCGVQRTDQGLQLCQERMVYIEEQMRERLGPRVPEIARSVISNSQGIMKQMAASATRGGISEVLRPLLALQQLPLRENGSHWLYEHRGSDGTSTRWTIQEDDNGLVAVRNAQNPAMMASVHRAEFLDILEHNRLPDLVKRAMDHYEAENNPRSVKAMEGFDLPHNEPVAYLRLFPRTYERVVANAVSTSNLMSLALRQRYPNLQSHPPLFSDNPRETLIATIRSLYQNGRGPRSFFLDVFNHGSRTGLDFETPLTARDLADVMDLFPDCHFTLNTMACFGGGLQQGFETELKNRPALANRLALFLQSRGNTVNLQSAQDRGGSDYYMHLITALYDPNVRTFGMAARRADREVKQYYPVDAESIIHGIRIGSNTSPPGTDRYT